MDVKVKLKTTIQIIDSYTIDEKDKEQYINELNEEFLRRAKETFGRLPKITVSIEEIKQ